MYYIESNHRWLLMEVVHAQKGAVAALAFSNFSWAVRALRRTGGLRHKSWGMEKWFKFFWIVLMNGAGLECLSTSYQTDGFIVVAGNWTPPWGSEFIFNLLKSSQLLLLSDILTFYRKIAIRSEFWVESSMIPAVPVPHRRGGGTTR